MKEGQRRRDKVESSRRSGAIYLFLGLAQTRLMRRRARAERVPSCPPNARMFYVDAPAWICIGYLMALASFFCDQ